MTKAHNWRIRSKLLLLILGTAAACVLLFIGLWHQQNTVCTLLERVGIVDWFDEEAFEERARALAKNYTVPSFYEEGDGENDPAVIAFQPYCDSLADELTSVAIYGDDGLYRAGKAADIVQRSWFNTIWTLSFKMLGEEICEFPIEFTNGTHSVIVYSYHRVRFTYPYLFFCLFVSIAVFLGSMILFVQRMTRRIHHIENAILQMAGGDLATPVPNCGNDEIGVVARELDTLRTTLTDNIQHELDAQRANRDLIMALSHDLRTPLTVLIGYLEVLKHSTGQSTTRYTERCLQKADELRVLTDHLFDAARTEETPAAPTLQQLPVSLFVDIVNSSVDFLQTCGFHIETSPISCNGTLLGDPTTLRRICDNLFFNIVKYGDKTLPVRVQLETDDTTLHLHLSNANKANTSEGSQIGLKNVRHLLENLGGTLETSESATHFNVHLSLPLVL